MVAEILVDPDDLRSVATHIHDIASQLGQALHRRAPDLTAPAPGGWSTGSTLGSAAAAWAPFLGTTRDDLHTCADDLRALADAFTAADGQATQRQRRAGQAFAA